MIDANNDEIVSKEHVSDVVLKLSRYNPEHQLGVGDLDNLYPEWRADRPDADPFILLCDVVKTNEMRSLANMRYTSLGIIQAIGDDGLERAMKDAMPSEVGRQFQGHGFGKSGSAIQELVDVLKNGIDKDRTFYTTSIYYNPEAGGALGADMPFTTGGLICVFGRGDSQGDNGIQSVLVGAWYINAIDTMRKNYPDITFVPWHDAPEYYTGLVNAAEGTEYRAGEIDDSIKPIPSPFERRIGGTAITAPELMPTDEGLTGVASDSEFPLVW